MNLWTRAAEERDEEAWALVKSYQESNNMVRGNSFEIVRRNSNSDLSTGHGSATADER